MLGDVELEIPEVDPFFRTNDDIIKTKRFHEEHGAEFSRRIAQAFNVLVHAKPHDPIASFVDAFRVEEKPPVDPEGTANPFYFAPLERAITAISVENGIDLTGSRSLDIVIQLHDDPMPMPFRFGMHFHQVTDGVAKVNLPPDDVQLRQNVMLKIRAVLEDCLLGYRSAMSHGGFICQLKEMAVLDSSLTEYFDKKTVIPEVPPPPFDFSGKKGKDKHPALKLPWPPKPKLIQRVKFNALEDGYSGICFLSFATFSLVAHQLALPVRQFIRVLAKVLVPRLDFPTGIPFPLITVFSNTKKPVGKVKIIQDIMLAPSSAYEPAKFFTSVFSVIRSFREKMLVHQKWRLHTRATMSWGMEKIQDAFIPLKKLTDDLDFHPALAVSFNTQELLAKGNYDVRGKPRPPEHVVKILSALIRRYPDLTALLSPINVEHRDRLKPFCDYWSTRHQILLFHENFAAFHETLSAYPVCFRGALISVRGEDTVSSVVRRVASAKELGLPVCLQNSSGMAFSESSILVEIAVGLGVEYLKLESAGRPELWCAAETYHELAELHCGRKPVFARPDELNSGVGSLPKIFSKHPVDSVRPALVDSATWRPLWSKFYDFVDRLGNMTQ